MNSIGRFLALFIALCSTATCAQMIGLTEGKPNTCASPLDCPSPGPCAVATCDNGVCGQASANEHATCDDGLFCTSDDVCSAGTCVGTPKMCAPTGNECMIASCDEDADACKAIPGPNGIQCDDGLFCTSDDACSAGTCVGTPTMCAPTGNECMIASCDEGADACKAIPGPNDIQCDDGDACTSGDRCQNGLCAGSATLICANGDACCPAGCTTAKDGDCAPLQAMAYDVTQSFLDTIQTIEMALAWDGTNFWGCSGADASGVRLASYLPSGTPLASYQPNIDFRALFTKGDGTSPLYAREFGSAEILVQMSPGVFGNDVTLSGGSLHHQGSVVYDAASSQFVTFSDGVVTRWGSDGVFASTLELEGFGNQYDEGDHPQSRRLIYTSGYYLTYSKGNLSAWNATGQRVASSLLDGAGTTVNAHFSLSYAAGKVWVMNDTADAWLGYDVGL